MATILVQLDLTLCQNKCLVGHTVMKNDERLVMRAVINFYFFFLSRIHFQVKILIPSPGLSASCVITFPLSVCAIRGTLLPEQCFSFELEMLSPPFIPSLVLHCELNLISPIFITWHSANFSLALALSSLDAFQGSFVCVALPMAPFLYSLSW